MLENIYENSTEYHTRMLPVFVHEISHAIGAPDHYHEPIDDEGTCRSGDICSKCGTNKRPEFCIMNQGGNIGNLSEISRDRIYCSWCISDISKHLNDHH